MRSSIRTSSHGRNGFCLRLTHLAISVFVIFGGMSCSTYQPSRDFHAELAQMPSGGVVISGVMDIDRAGRKDGILASAPILHFWGVDPVDPSEAYVEEIDGVEIIPVEETMARIFEARDLWSFSFNATLRDVEVRLEAGIPLLVMVQDNPMNIQTRRYMILVGFNRVAEKLLALEGGTYPGVYTYAAFRRIWRPVRSWLNVVCPPENITWNMRTLEVVTLARYRERKGDWQVALHDYERAADMDPANPQIMLARARALYESDDILGAIVHYRRILDRDEMNATAANNLAYILISTGGSLAESERLIRRALTIEPSNPAYLDTLGLTLLKAGRPGEAAQVLSRARHRADTMPIEDQRKITRRLITAYMESGQEHLARQVAAEQQRRDPDFRPDQELVDRLPR